MIIKIDFLSWFVIIFLTVAVEVTDEDINSPLVPYLLAKVRTVTGGKDDDYRQAY